MARRRGILWIVVAGLAMYESVLLASGLFLGSVGLLRAPAPLVLWSVVAAGFLVLAARGAGSVWAAGRSALHGVRLRPVDLLLGPAALATALLMGLQVARDWIEGTIAFDALSYHIPRVLLWARHGDFRPTLSPVWQQVGLPVGGDVLLLPGVVLGIGWLGAAWTTVWLSLGAAAAVFAATRLLGAGRRPSLVAALAFLSFPAVGFRLVDVSSDMAAAFPLLAAWVLATRARSLAEGAFLFPALAGAAIACKANVAPAVLVLAAGLFASRFRGFADWRALAAASAGAAAAALLCAASYLPVWRLFGDLVGGPEGRDLVSYLRGTAGVVHAALFGLLHWAVEPFALVPEPPRFDWLDSVGLDRLYQALGAGTRERWYPLVDATTNRSGVFPFLASPVLLALLPKGRRLKGALLFLALLLALFAPLNPNCYASRFSVVLLAAFAVLWGAAAQRSTALVALLVSAGLVVEARTLGWRDLPRFADRQAPDRNARVAAAVGSQTLLLLSGALSVDAKVAGRRADVRIDYLACPPDGDWVRHFERARRESPWLLLNDNAPQVATGPSFATTLAPPCPGVAVPALQQALTAAGWRPAFEENGYQVWSAVPATGADVPR